MNKLQIVFVCLGNYCRSPMAEAIFRQLAKADGLLDKFEITSAGTKDWDIGLKPDYRTRQILKEHNYPLDPQKTAQMISSSVIMQTDYLIAMSQRIADELGNQDNVFLLMDFVECTQVSDIPDPYPSNTFQQVFEMIEQGVTAFYNQIKNKVINT
jgi:protein-tyrosine phosphatase